MLFLWFFFHVLFLSFWPGCSNGSSNGSSFGVRRSFLIIFLFPLNISWRTSLIKNRMWKRSFLTILYAQQNLKGCVAWALLRKSADWVGCCAKCIIFKDTRWTELLHVAAESHSTFLNGRTVFPCSMEKWVSMFDFYWSASKFNEVKD